MGFHMWASLRLSRLGSDFGSFKLEATMEMFRHAVVCCFVLT
jgi:hypothetical protein